MCIGVEQIPHLLPIFCAAGTFQEQLTATDDHRIQDGIKASPSQLPCFHSLALLLEGLHGWQAPTTSDTKGPTIFTAASIPARDSRLLPSDPDLQPSLWRRLTLRLAHVTEHSRPDCPLGLYGFFVRLLVRGEFRLRLLLAAQAAVSERQLVVSIRILGLKFHRVLQGRNRLLSAAGRNQRFAQTDEGFCELRFQLCGTREVLNSQVPLPRLPRHFSKFILGSGIAGVNRQLLFELPSSIVHGCGPARPS